MKKSGSRTQPVKPKSIGGRIGAAVGRAVAGYAGAGSKPPVGGTSRIDIPLRKQKNPG